MNLQQLRYFNEIVRRNFKISDAAESLFTSQPNISKQIRLFEEELGVDLFVRHGKRIISLSKPGEAIFTITKRMLSDAENLKKLSKDFHTHDQGQLTIATTHTQARYALPDVIRRFMQQYPKVQLSLHQGNPTQIAEQVLSGEADIGIATESLALYDELLTLPCYQWNHCIIAPLNHPILNEPKLTLTNIAEYPIITYDFAFSGRSKINQAFTQAGISPNVALTAIDADVIKTYVELGLGIGILAKMAINPERDTQLAMRDASHLFQASTTKIAIAKNSYLRSYVYDFMNLFSTDLTREKVMALRES